MLNRRAAVVILAVFAAAVASREMVFALPAYREVYADLPELAQRLEQPLRWILFVLVGLRLLHRQSLLRGLCDLGLAASPIVALRFSMLACSPMLLGPLLAGRWPVAVDFPLLVFSAGIWPFAEELLYRGFAFGQLHLRANIPWLPAAALTALVFGAVHLGQASVRGLPATGAAATVAIVGIGGLLYAWLYVRWDRNLWVPVCMHMFMNLAWSVYQLADSPLGGWFPNLLRALTVVVAILLSLRRKAGVPSTPYEASAY